MVEMQVWADSGGLEGTVNSEFIPREAKWKIGGVEEEIFGGT